MGGPSIPQAAPFQVNDLRYLLLDPEVAPGSNAHPPSHFNGFFSHLKVGRVARVAELDRIGGKGL